MDSEQIAHNVVFEEWFRLNKDDDYLQQLHHAQNEEAVRNGFSSFSFEQWIKNYFDNFVMIG